MVRSLRPRTLQGLWERASGRARSASVPGIFLNAGNRIETIPDRSDSDFDSDTDTTVTTRRSEAKPP
jgi:hypothetical protein